jgi:ribosomal-protein-alanine N-acetyltransferase
MHVTSSDRLLLRRFVPADAAAMEDVLCDPDVMRFSRGPLDPEVVPAWIEQRRSDYEQLGYGLWAVVGTDDGDVLGYCGLTLFPDIDGASEIEVGYRLRRDAWGRGYATEAALAVRDLALGPLGVERLVAIIDPTNHASLNVARKLGMAYEKEVLMDGYDHPDHLYVLEARVPVP